MTDPPHEVDVSDTVELAVASLSEHKRYLELLSDDPVEDAGTPGRRHVDTDRGRRRRVGFRLFWG